LIGSQTTGRSQATGNDQPIADLLFKKFRAQVLEKDRSLFLRGVVARFRVYFYLPQALVELLLAPWFGNRRKAGNLIFSHGCAICFHGGVCRKYLFGGELQ
jgi:hypothetical protein